MITHFIEFLMNNESIINLLGITGMIVSFLFTDLKKQRLIPDTLMVIFWCIIFVNVLVNGLQKGF